MIENVSKYLFWGVNSDLEGFLKESQKLGVIEFKPSSGKKPLQLTKKAEKLLSAIKILKKETKFEQSGHLEERSPEEIAQTVIKLKNTFEKNHEIKRQLKNEIRRVKVFGDFSQVELKKLEMETGYKARFYTSRISKRDILEKDNDLIYLGSDNALDYYIAFSQKDTVYAGYSEVVIERPLGELRNKLKRTNEETKKAHEQLTLYVHYIDILREALLEEMNSYHFEFTLEEVSHHFEKKLFFIEAWVPDKFIPKLDKLTKQFRIKKEKITIEASERVPTYMDNKNVSKMGEDLVKIYDIPAPEDKDPSIFVICAFAIFFSMIVADAGYGLLYLLISAFGFYKLRKAKESIRRMFKLFMIVSSCCIVWGICIGSYFGLELKPDNPLQKVSILNILVHQKAKYHIAEKDDVFKEWAEKSPAALDAKTSDEFLLSVQKQKGDTIAYEILEEFKDNIMIELSLLVGVIHICLSLARYLLRNYAAIGWIIFVLGGYLFFPSMLHATSIIHFTYLISKATATAFGFQMLWIGISAAWIIAIIQNKLKGLEEPLQAIQIFADVLSYLRLYALALAAMIMASTFNQIGRETGFALGTLIIIVGHVTNMTLGIMGGVIHGLRLNFLEWYHYCFEGGGKLFKPLKIEK